MENKVTRELHLRGARDRARGRLFVVHIGEIVFGCLLLLVLWPEFVVSRDTWDKVLRDWQGNLPAYGDWMTLGLAVVTCSITVLSFHWLLNRIARRPGGILIGAGLVVIAAIVVGQSAVGLLTELRFGNSLDASPSQSLAAANETLLLAVGVRCAVILVAALIAAAGSHLIEGGIHRAREAWRCRQDAKTAFSTVSKMDRGYQKAMNVRTEATSKNEIDARTFAAAVAQGFHDMSSSIARYLNGPVGPFANPEQWLQEISDQLSVVSRDIEPEIARLVHGRLSRHFINFGALPAMPEQLAPSTRARLGEYATWLYQQADADAIYAATVTRMEDVHA